MIADVEIRLLPREEKGYPVEIEVETETGDQHFPRGYAAADALPTLSSSASDSQQGHRLWQWLLADPILQQTWAKLASQYPQRRLRLRLDAAAPELHPLPWELLNDSQVSLAASTHTPFSRYLAVETRPQPPIEDNPVRILVAVANPDGLDKFGLQPVDMEKEWALMSAAASDPRFALTFLPAPVTLDRLETELRQGYHILHLVAHGQMARSGKNAFLYLADGQNQAKAIRDDEFIDMLNRFLGGANVTPDTTLRLVYLSSCQTATRNPAEAFRGLAPRLVESGFAAVVAMQDLVPVVTAQAFAQTFYEQLAQSGQVDAAANSARSRLITAQLPGAAIPVLFSRLRNNQLLSGNYKTRLPFEPEMVYIPAGPFVMGADTAPGITASEMPRHELTLPAFRMGKYPVTNGQYAEFIKQTNQVVSREMGWFGRTPPVPQLNHPVVGISWHDAQAYCRWLKEQTGRAYRLPTEAEWEKAARGKDGRLYPWGNTWQDDACQHDQVGTAPVDAFPGGISPYGCLDMLGNASEWTSTLWGTDPTQPAFPYPYQVDGREDTAASGHRLYRGGSYRDNADRLRCSARSWYAPDHRDKKRGFRVAMG